MKKNLKRWVSVGLGVAGLVLLGAVPEAAAQQRKPKRILLDKIVVTGTIQKPQAFYILQRSNLNFDGLELKNSFLPKIAESVQKAPF